jgi:hypothetical protein
MDLAELSEKSIELAKKAIRPWTDLRGISNSTAAKGTILIPLIGYWIVFNETAVHWLRLARQFSGGDPEDHISARLLWLYMALCAIGAGTFIYALRCPPEIKKYGDYKDYINGDGDAMTIRTVENIRHYLQGIGYSGLGAADKNDVLAVHFDELNSQRLYSRLSVTLLFVFGFVILSMLSAQVFLRVLRLLVGI